MPLAFVFTFMLGFFAAAQVVSMWPTLKTEREIICRYEGGEKIVDLETKRYCLDKNGQIVPLRIGSEK